MQFQKYPDYEAYAERFGAFLQEVDNADKIHYRAATAIAGNLRQLGGIIPHITDAHGQLCLHFRQHRFEVLDSSLTDRRRHRIQLSFISEPLLWLDTLPGSYLLAPPEQLAALRLGREVLTTEMPFQPHLSVYAFQALL